MRILSPAALAKFSESGFEPVLLVHVLWEGGNGIIYSDKKFEQYGFEGKLISIGSIDDIVNVDGSSNSAHVSVVIDATDSVVKQIFNRTDIHKTKVRILQWCPDLPPSDAFLLFVGQISSPIEWREGDRTLSFDVVTQIEDREVGFSIEDGLFPLFPSKLIGASWPIVFGQVVGIPPLQILEAPSGILAEGIAIVNDNVWTREMEDLEAERLKAIENARIAYANGLNEAVIAGRYKGESSGGFNFSFLIGDDPQAAESHDIAARNYFNQALGFSDDAINIATEMALKQQLWDLQKSYDKTVFKVNTVNMPSNTPLVFKLGSATYYGSYHNGQFHVTDRKFPEDFNHKPYVNYVRNGETAEGVRTSDIFGNGPQEVEFGQKFLWVDAGTEIHIENFPLTFVVSVGVVNIERIYGYRRGIRVPVPTNYYTITNEVYGNTTCTLVTLSMPLTSRTFFNGVNTISEGWDNDQIEIDGTSVVGSNTVDIMTWIITLFTDFQIDATSFNFVKEKLTNYPMNFALLEKKNVVTLLQELAYQARCSIWLNDDKFFLRYLPLIPTPIETITGDDIVLNSLVVTTTETEDLVTSYTATWRPNLYQKEDYKIIYKYNIPRYGFKRGSYDYYAYNQEALVRKSAEFWLIRQANSYKILKFKTALHKIRIETFDAVTINLPSHIVCNDPIVGTVLKAVYNTEDNTIDIDVWLPVRLGEMTRYEFAEPFDVSLVYPIATDPNIKNENPFQLAGIIPQQQYVLEQHTPTWQYFGVIEPTFGRSQIIRDAVDTAPESPLQDNETIPIWPVVPARIGEISNTNNYLKYKVNPLKVVEIKEPTNASFPGIVKGKNTQSGSSYYDVAVYYNGLDAESETAVVKQFQQLEDDEVTEGTAVEVRRLVWRHTDGTLRSTLWMQAPTWQKPPASEDDS